jgi:hypothetical protein
MAQSFTPHNFIVLECNIYYKKITTFQKANLIEMFTLKNMSILNEALGHERTCYI